MEKNIYLFETHNEFEEYSTSIKANLPHVSYTVEDDLVRYNGQLDIKHLPLTFEFLEDGSFGLIRQYYSYSYHYIYCTFKVYRNGVLAETYTRQGDSTTSQVKKGDIITIEFSSGYDNEPTYYFNSNYYYYFRINAKCYVYGNIMSLSKQGVDSREIYSTTMFRELFKNCPKMLNHPTKDLYLPATTLNNGCYYSMFTGCTGLTRSPELPALSVPAEAYYNMFNNCSSLKEVKAAFTRYDNGSTNNWLSGVSSTGIFYKNNLATWSTVGPNGVPESWIVKRYIPK